jgi:hypothetical protein
MTTTSYRKEEKHVQSDAVPVELVEYTILVLEAVKRHTDVYILWMSDRLQLVVSHRRFAQIAGVRIDSNIPSAAVELSSSEILLSLKE